MAKQDFLGEAMRLREKIEQLYNHGRSTGYDEACSYMNILVTLIGSASKSKYGKNEVPFIHSTYKDMMELIERWAKEENKK